MRGGIMSINNSVLLFLLVVLPISIASSLSLCIPREREALLKFKSNLTDPSNILSSWVEDSRGADCCLWHGVACHNFTGHVLQISLPSMARWSIYCDENQMALGGELNPSLLDLKHLTHLDLSGNCFGGIGIPPFLGSLKNLRYLNLADGGFGGPIPHQLGNLSCLKYLNLSGERDYLFGLPLKSESLWWVSGMSSLQHLDLSWTNLSAANDWVRATNTLPSLQRLLLFRCSLLNRETPSPPPLNFSSLSELDLSYNSFPSIPEWIFSRLPGLTSLDLSWNGFTGPIPVGLRNMTHLRVLYLSSTLFNCNLSDLIDQHTNLKKLTRLVLSQNSLSGPIPESIGNLSSLKELDLSDNELHGPIPASIGNLSSLKELDLSYNELHGPIPASIGNLSSLKELDLSYNELHGPIPDSIGNLSSLKELDLIYNELHGPIPDSIGNLSSLKQLDLSHNELHDPIPDSIGNLSSLKELDLSSNELHGPIPDSIGNLSSLEVLNLFLNKLNGPIPESIGNLKCLKILRAGSNQLHGPIPESIGGLSSLEQFLVEQNELDSLIPESIGNLKFLRKLEVRSNRLHGPIPKSIGGLSSLEDFFVAQNQLNGTLPASFGQLINLVNIETSHNPMQGVVSELQFANLTKLKTLNASGNELSLNVSPKWLPPFQLSVLRLDFWRIGPLFPSWLRSQKSLTELQMSNVGISSSIPKWFWISLPQCQYYNLSHNQLHGHLKNLPSFMPSTDLSAIDLSSNQLGGTLPIFPLGLVRLDISNNSFSGFISNFLCYKPHALKSLIYLNLRDNKLSGKIPNCWMSWTRLKILNLESNEFVGNVPSSIGHIEGLRSLHLRKNHLKGEVLPSLMNCTMLKIVNLGENNFEGNIPSWFGEKLILMNILILRSNKFHGHIPNQLCMLEYLQLLDLAHNSLFATIPRCFNNITAMITAPTSSSTTHIELINSIGAITEDALVFTKGNGWVYTNNLGLMTAMDLSNNNLTGIIPIELTSLAGLRSLNLSNNFLVGQIPHDIGAMRVIESIDVSGNEISGQIPLSISHLTSLCWLNLSNNHLVGEIPMGPQLQRLLASGFSGNKLCGSPLPNNCSSSSSSMEFSSKQGKVKDGVAVGGVYVSMAIGFIVGFWIVWFPLIFSKSWRWFYFTSIDRMWKRFASGC